MSKQALAVLLGKVLFELQTYLVQANFDWEQQSKSRHAAYSALEESVHNFNQGMQVGHLLLH